MLARQAPRRNSDQSESTMPKGQTRRAERSFKSKEAAATAGRLIKKAFPVVLVTVVDAETGATEIVPA